MTYDRQMHVDVAERAKAAMARSAAAHRRASNATFALILPTVAYHLGASDLVLWLGIVPWCGFVAHAGVLMVEAHRLLIRLDQLNREAL